MSDIRSSFNNIYFKIFWIQGFSRENALSTFLLLRTISQIKFSSESLHLKCFTLEILYKFLIFFATYIKNTKTILTLTHFIHDQFFSKFV